MCSVRFSTDELVLIRPPLYASDPGRWLCLECLTLIRALGAEKAEIDDYVPTGLKTGYAFERKRG